MIARLVAWFRRQVCVHRYTDARFRWNGEYAEFYEECLNCGKELFYCRVGIALVWLLC